MGETVQEFMILPDMKRSVNEDFLSKAEAFRPVLKHKTVYPVDTAFSGHRMRKGECVCIDFGSHYVGYLTFKVSAWDSLPDAPALLKLKFAEHKLELERDSADYDGWISRAWIQEEYIHIDSFEEEIRLPRRYAFRYLEVTTIDTSMKFSISVDSARIDAVSAVDYEVEALDTDDELIQAIDRVAINTLRNCMQEVFEDGPKRDRRLWIGDLRLQAKANYKTYKNIDLVKRCLYLFAGTTREDGLVGACLFTKPKPIVDDTFFFDYSLFFVSCLYDFYKYSKDNEVLEDLYDCAFKQLKLASTEFGADKVYCPNGAIHPFIDWKAELDKTASAQAIYIYCLKQGLFLAKEMGRELDAEWIRKEISDKSEAAVKNMWDESLGLFVSGSNRQVSIASQAWMILAEVVDEKSARAVLEKVASLDSAVGMVSPYACHHYVEALFKAGMKDEAYDYIKYYWGGMVKLGTDTFWELYNPNNPGESPYGSPIVNSYCHAWSCTPAFLFR